MNGDSSAACYIFMAPCISYGFLHFFQIHAKRRISQQILEHEHPHESIPVEYQQSARSRLTHLSQRLAGIAVDLHGLVMD